MSTDERHILGPALRRFWFVALLAGILGGLGTSWVVANLSNPSWTASATYVVPTTPPVADPDAQGLNVYDAERLARTYAVIITSDQQLVQAISERSGIPTATIWEGAVAQHLPSSSAIRVTFTAETPEAVDAYFSTLTPLLEDPSGTTRNLPSGLIEPLQLPNAAQEQAGLAPVAPVLGVLAGLLIGAATAVTLERIDHRLRNVANLRALTLWPVFDAATGLTRQRAETVVLRVLDDPAPVRLVAVAVPARTPMRMLQELTASLEHAADSLRVAGRVPADEVEWIPAGALSTGGQAERTALDCDATVLVVPHKSAQQWATLALESLEDLGRSRVVVVLGPPVTSRHRVRRAVRRAATALRSALTPPRHRSARGWPSSLPTSGASNTASKQQPVPAAGAEQRGAHAATHRDESAAISRRG